MGSVQIFPDPKNIPSGIIRIVGMRKDPPDPVLFCISQIVNICKGKQIAVDSIISAVHIPEKSSVFDLMPERMFSSSGKPDDLRSHLPQLLFVSDRLLKVYKVVKSDFFRV